MATSDLPGVEGICRHQTLTSAEQELYDHIGPKKCAFTPTNFETTKVFEEFAHSHAEQNPCILTAGSGEVTSTRGGILRCSSLADLRGWGGDDIVLMDRPEVSFRLIEFFFLTNSFIVLPPFLTVPCYEQCKPLLGKTPLSLCMTFKMQHRVEGVESWTEHWKEGDYFFYRAYQWFAASWVAFGPRELIVSTTNKFLKEGKPSEAPLSARAHIEIRGTAFLTEEDTEKLFRIASDMEDGCLTCSSTTESWRAFMRGEVRAATVGEMACPRGVTWYMADDGSAYRDRRPVHPPERCVE